MGATRLGYASATGWSFSPDPPKAAPLPPPSTMVVPPAAATVPPTGASADVAPSTSAAPAVAAPSLDPSALAASGAASSNPACAGYWVERARAAPADKAARPAAPQPQLVKDAIAAAKPPTLESSKPPPKRPDTVQVGGPRATAA